MPPSQLTPYRQTIILVHSNQEGKDPEDPILLFYKDGDYTPTSVGRVSLEEGYKRIELDTHKMMMMISIKGFVDLWADTA